MRPGVRAARWREPLRVWIVILGAVFLSEALVMVILPSLLPSEPPLLAAAAIDAILLTVVVAPVLWVLIVRPLREANRVRAEFLSELFASIEADRRQTARELHDGVGQALTVLVSGLRSASAEVTSPELGQRCVNLKALARQALQEVKRLSLGLRPSLLDDLGLSPAIERLVLDLKQNHPVEVELSVTPTSIPRLVDAVETALFRIVQEALSNVISHSRATHVWIEIIHDDGVIELTVRDDGVGMSSAVRNGSNTGHLGLTGMRERAVLLGGELVIDSAPGRGTRLMVKIPVEGARA